MVDQRMERHVPPGDRSYLSIGEVLALLQDEFPDVTISKIRFLESQGLIDPERTPSGYRKFYDIDIARLRFILHEQKEHFLPLKVIKDRLDSGELLGKENGRPASEAPGDDTDPGEAAETASAPVAPEPAEPRLPVWMVKPPPSSSATNVRSIASGATFSFEEVAASAGLTVDDLREIERFGVVTGRPAGGGTTVYDEHAVVAARVAAQFLSFGVEPRHMRLYRTGADREAGLIEQLILPLVKQRNPAAHAQARTTLESLVRLGAELHDAILRQSLHPYAD